MTVASCKIASKAKSVLPCQPKRSRAIIKCPDEEIGKNSAPTLYNPQNY